MKKVIFSVIAATALSSSLFAGKNVAPAPVPPLPVPEAPAPEKPTVLPPLGLYVGGGLTYAKTSCKCAPLNTTSGIQRGQSSGKSYGVNLRGGYEYNEYVGIEARYLYTPWGDKDKTMKHYGIYLKPMAPVTDNFDVYALLGYGKTKCEYHNLDEKGFAWGLGGEYMFSEKKEGAKDGFGIYAEYSRPIKKSGAKTIKTDVLSTGVSYHF